MNFFCFESDRAKANKNGSCFGPFSLTMMFKIDLEAATRGYDVEIVLKKKMVYKNRMDPNNDPIYFFLTDFKFYVTTPRKIFFFHPRLNVIENG